MEGGVVFVLSILFGGFFAMVFGVYYLRTRQNLAMIDKGMNPRQAINQPAPYRNLKWAMLLIGAGSGLLAAYFVDLYAIPHEYYTQQIENVTYRHETDHNPAIYFALIAIGGGLGLFSSYRMEKKWWDDNKEKA